jgi:O6-methylguanine-DNA--protein-cysteine methyltransferase
MSDGSIGGYSGLPGVKKALLAAEGAPLATAASA